jgi:hypothetical protein
MELGEAKLSLRHVVGVLSYMASQVNIHVEIFFRETLSLGTTLGPFIFGKKKKSTIAVTRSGVLWHGMGVRGNAHVSGLSQGNAYMLWVRTFVERALVGVFGPGRRQ